MEKINWGNPPVGLFNFPITLWHSGGEFARRGLDLHMTTHLTGQEYAKQIRSAAYDMGHIGTPVFLPAAAGSDEYAVISTGVCDYAPFYFVASPEIESLVDCQGQPFVINKRRTCPHSLLKWHARQYQLTEDDFQLVELMDKSKFDNYGAAFLDGIDKGAFKAGILYEPYVSLIEREFGWRVLGDYPELSRPANYAILLYARRSWIKDKPQLVEEMVDAYFDCARMGKTTPEKLEIYSDLLPFIKPADIRQAIRRESPHWKMEPSLDLDLIRRVEAELLEQQWVAENYRIADYLSALH